MYSRQERLSVYHRFTEVPCLRASLNQSKAPWRVCYDEQGLVPLLLPDFILFFNISLKCARCPPFALAIVSYKENAYANIKTDNCL